METNTELLNRIEAHINGRLAVAESRAASSELYEGKKIAYNSILGVIKSLRADCDTAEQAEPAPAATIKGWVARNKFGGLGIFHGEEVPRKDKENGFWYVLGEDYYDNTIFPDLRWEDEPKPVRVIIEEIKD